MTTSRWISRSISKASVSSVRLTVPSIAFSIGTNPISTVPSATAAQHIDDRGNRQQRAGDQIGLREQRLLGKGAQPDPRYATAGDWLGAAELTMTGEDSDMDEQSLRSLLDAVRRGMYGARRGGGRITAPAVRRSRPHARSIITGRCAKAWPRRFTRRVRRPSSAPTSSTSCWRAVRARAADPRSTICRPKPRWLAIRTARRHGRSVVWRQAAEGAHRVAVVTAGTADLPVADECATVLRAQGVAARRITDVGVAGLHRLLAELDAITGAEVVVVIAGMEGALASVIGGLTAAPVVAVPTSVGYGSSLEGVTALLAMHAACASGITVVGIDNGFGAACAVLRMLTLKGLQT